MKTSFFSGASLRSSASRTNTLRQRVLTMGVLALTVPMLAQLAPAQAQSLNGAGATFPVPIYSKWFATYAQKTGVQINYQAVGSGAGIKQLKANTVDFAGSDAPLSNADLATIPGKVMQIPTVAGSVAVAYNVAGIGSGLKLTAPVLADIFAGKITKWNDARITGINAGKKLPATSISIAHRSDGSGTTNIFTSYLSAISPAWKAQIGAGKTVSWPVGLGGKGNDGVTAIIKQGNGTIGYVELAYAMSNRLTVAALRNKSGKYVMPSVASTSAAAAGAAAQTAKDPRAPIFNQGGNAYPIAGYTFLMYYASNANTPKGKQLTRFLNWAMSSGQQYAGGLMYAPLPKSVVASNKSRLK